jgi:hypothetical protein
MKRFVTNECGCLKRCCCRSKSTWDKRILGKLRRNGILHSEKVAYVLNSNKNDSPFLPLPLFRLTAVDDSKADIGPAADFGVPCPSLSTCATTWRNSSVVALSRRYQLAYATNFRNIPASGS